MITIRLPKNAKGAQRLINCDNLKQIDTQITGRVASKPQPQLLGIYQTRERAEEVFDMIFEATKAKESVFVMPKE